MPQFRPEERGEEPVSLPPAHGSRFHAHLGLRRERPKLERALAATLGGPTQVGRSRGGRSAASCSRSRGPSRPWRPPPPATRGLARPLPRSPARRAHARGTRRGEPRTREARQPEPSNVPHRRLDGGYGAAPGVDGRRLLAAGAGTTAAEDRAPRRTASWGPEDAATAHPPGPTAAA